MEEDKLLYTKEDGIAIITINRPEKMNAITDDMLADLTNLLNEAPSTTRSGPLSSLAPAGLSAGVRTYPRVSPATTPWLPRSGPPGSVSTASSRPR